MFEKLHPHITKLKHKLFSTKQRAIISICIFLIIGAGIAYIYDHFAKGATYGWLQSSWSGNADTLSTANHTNNQNNWNKFFSKNDNISAETEITLNSTNLTKTDSTTENFQTGTNTNGTYPILNTNNELKLDVPTCNTTIADAGIDQTGTTTCGLTTVTLNGNAPTVGTGSWTKVSGAGGTFANANLRNTTFTGTAGLTYVLRWTISNAPCTASADDVTITFNRNPTVANAGCDQYLYDSATATSVTGNTPSIGTGLWTVVSGTATITSPSSPTSGITGLSTNGTAILRWTISTLCNDSIDEVAITTATDTWSCGLPLNVSHATTNGVAPVNKTVSYGTILSNLSGASKCWITQNLGACPSAISATDNTEAASGWYWQFNRKQGYKYEGTTRTPASWITSAPASGNWLSVNDPCTILLGTNWRIPTYTEWLNADTDGAWNSLISVYDSVLKLHAAGVLNATNGSLYFRGSSMNYWSNQAAGSPTTYAHVLHAVSSSCGFTSVEKTNGYTLRCIKD
ncbi:MAG: hypothetical protein WAV31_01390 [Candidatus Moraniibacteriota bacterium]